MRTCEVNWTAGSHRCATQSGEEEEEEEDYDLTYVTKDANTKKKKNLVADKCESNVFYYI